ncbi:GNAT family N-acetyltransferase [Bacillus sp. FJAT-45350]|uniref:GNAT family N-acetyltransferase n=1 Tax=Bacillus sp. FJAT-45350 TaxID=2011014 RepID=UPI000BB99BCC|nr:GNAT family protein [Bacillus sp. FJAT-45350]
MFTYDIDEVLKLKLLEINDKEPLFNLIMNSKLHLKEWLPWVEHTKRIEDTEAFIKLTMKQFAENNGFQAGIWYEGEIAGVIGFHRIDWSNKSTSIGYWLGKDYEGLGIMTKSCKALVNHALVEWKLNRVEIRAAEQNIKSIAIPERLGFIKEGVIRQSEWLDGKFVDHIVYGVLAEDWR